MDLLLGNKASAGDAAGDQAAPIRDVTVQTFERDVITASMTTPVIVDFWATWCGPCKQLGPMLERAVTAAGGKVILAKVDIDRNPEIAQALRVQSVPTVYAFVGGQPVDGFAGAVPESQVKQFVDKLVTQAGGGGAADSLDAYLDQAKAAIEGGKPQVARQIYSEILDIEAANVTARAGLARLLMADGQADLARKLLDEAPAELVKHADLVAVRTALDLAAQSGNAGSSTNLKATLDADPADQATRFELAMAYYGDGNREAAVDTLLDSIRIDRTFNDEEARKQLVRFFEAFGATDPLTVSARKRLSSLLFR